MHEKNEIKITCTHHRARASQTECYTNTRTPSVLHMDRSLATPLGAHSIRCVARITVGRLCDWTTLAHRTASVARSSGNRRRGKSTSTRFSPIQLSFRRPISTHTSFKRATPTFFPFIFQQFNFFHFPYDAKSFRREKENRMQCFCCDSKRVKYNRNMCTRSVQKG